MFQVKVWFQNRRMKHKRQTLGKTGEDGDDKDSINSDGGKSGKLSTDKFLEDEMSKKSCQGCEMPTSAGLCGSHEELPDISSTRTNNNNTPSATNNNTNFNNNSNGASSVGSSSSFDKLIAEEDSRSNEDSGSHPSPRVSKKGSSTSSSVSVKVEGRRNSPSDRKIGLSKVSPSVNNKENNIDVAISVKMSPKTSNPGGNNNLHPASLGMGSSNMVYPHLQRSSPTTATAIASATVTIQNVSNSIPPFASRGSMPHFANQYQINSQHEYRDRAKHPQQHYQMNHTIYSSPSSSSEMYNPEHPTVSDGQAYLRGPNHPTNALSHGVNRDLPSRVSARGRQAYHANYPTQQQYYYNKTHNTEGYMNHHQNYVQGYQSDHPNYNHYGYHSGNMYPSDGSEVVHNMTNSVHIAHDSSYYQNENLHSMQKNQTEYPSKVAYYENNHHYNTANQQMTGNSDSTYIAPEVFSNTNNTSTAIMTPPASVQTETSDNYNAFHQFYSSESSQNQVAPATTGGENSNSSSDFNFLSNLANDYTPEYYQI